jgi:hypothetical protein
VPVRTVVLDARVRHGGSPALVAKLPLEDVSDLAQHTLLNITSMPRLWHEWLVQAGQPRVTPTATLTFDHVTAEREPTCG